MSQEGTPVETNDSALHSLLGLRADELDQKGAEKRVARSFRTTATIPEQSPWPTELKTTGAYLNWRPSKDTG